MDELSGLPESVRKLALDRFRLLQPHLEQNRPLRPIAIEAGIPYRTAQRWVTRFQRFGLAALIRKKRTDAGVRRAVPIKIKAAIEGLALQKPPLPISALHRQVQRFSLNLGKKAPSYKVVYSIVRGLPADLLTLAHRGTKAYSEAFDFGSPARGGRPERHLAGRSFTTRYFTCPPRRRTGEAVAHHRHG
jgi:putative transposase